MSDAPTTIKINIKGPSDVKLTLDVDTSSTVKELKEQIEQQNGEFKADQQRLIYSGRILKDDDQISKFSIKDGNTVHLVKGARPAGPSGVPGTSAAAGVPSTFGAGQAVMGNPLAPLMNATNAGALAGFNPFAQMGINPNDPNYMQQMMRDPAVQANVNQLLSDPAVIDQVIAANPELAAMGPQVRQLMQSEHFRSFLTNPDAMQQMMGMMGGGAGGAGGAGGGFPAPGAFGWGSGAGAGAGTDNAAGAAPAQGLFNPWASTPPAPSTPGAAAGNPPGAGTPGAFNPFAAFGGGGAAGQPGGAPDFAAMMQQMQQLQQLQNLGGFGSPAAAAPSGPVQSPEERFATQLEQLQGMGFHDASRNVRALLASGGNVEMAVEWLFSN